MARPLRWLVICHEFPPVGGGAGNAAQQISRALSARHQVTVITSGCSEQADDEGCSGITLERVRVRRRWTGGSSPWELLAFTLSAIRAACRLHRQQPFDVCLAIHAIPAAWVSLVLWRRYRLPYVVSLRGADVPGFLYGRFRRLLPLLHALTPAAWRGARAVVANSDGLKRLADRTAARLDITVRVIPNGVDAQFYRPPQARAPSGVLRGLFVGRLTAQKGLDDLCQALARSQQALCGRLVIEVAGEGKAKGRLMRDVTRQGLSDLVQWTPWRSKEELLHKYQEASFLVLPSLDEGMSNVILEAMACGLPVVATAIDGNRALVEEGVSGWLVPPHDPAALGEVLVRLVRQGAWELAEVGRAARQRAEAFDWRTVAEAYEACALNAPGSSQSGRIS